MILYLYAIADGLDRIDDVAGLDGEPLTLLTLEGVQLIASEIDALPQVDEAALSRQDATVRHLHARAEALLPMRFGAAFASTADLQRVLSVRVEGLRGRLALVRGADQMTLRVVGVGGTGGISATGATGATGAQSALPEGLLSEAPSGATVGAGVQYLRSRAAKAMPLEIVPLLDALKPSARATRVEPGRAAGLIATVYQLIDRGASAEYEATARRAAAMAPELSVRISGPAPCYAFT